MSDLDTLPPEQRDAAHAALREVIGRTTADAVTPISGGATSARLFRIDAGGRNYLLRLEGPPSPLRNLYQYGSLRIAPRLYYVE
jgi:hypothetical protein